MHRSIEKLSSYVADQISAGEVVERPVSIVKELIENSIDAGSTQIDIFIEEGGTSLIKVRDNGTGIVKKEATLVFARHATSKIYQIEDIEKIQTLGFRGEALASISAIARVHLMSRTIKDRHGWQTIAKPNQPLPFPTPTSHMIGSTVEITELFYNVPARRRFLRTSLTEFSRIHAFVKCIALYYANIGLTLYHNHKEVIRMVPQETIEARHFRIFTVFGETFFNNSIFVNKEEPIARLSGWISSPNFSRSQANLQYFYVNGRCVKDKLFNHAVKMAYQDVLYRKHRPALVIFLEISPTEVDVNVHPMKSEVRFHQSRKIYEIIFNTIKEGLSQKQWHLKETNVSFNSPVIQQKIAYSHQNTLQNISHLKENSVPQLSTHRQQLQFKMENSQEIVKPYEHAYIKDIPLGYALAQLHGIYILAQNEQGLVIVDAHAAHERVLYEKLKKVVKEKIVSVQKLLIPIALKIDEEELELAKTQLNLFKKLGFDYIIQQENTLLLTEVPALLHHLPISKLVKEVFFDLKTRGCSHRVEDTLNHLLAALCCKSAIHANKKLSIEEMNTLLRSIEKTQHGGQCNHGRPTWKQLTLKELDRWFFRGQ